MSSRSARAPAMTRPGTRTDSISPCSSDRSCRCLTAGFPHCSPTCTSAACWMKRWSSPWASLAVRPGSARSPSSAGADKGGRDHWPHCYTVLFAGGGMPAGAIHGASDAHAAYPARDAVTPQDITATIYSALGIDPTTSIRDSLDRPYVLSAGSSIRALVG